LTLHARSKVLNLWIRDVDTQHICKLEDMVGVNVIESPNEIVKVFTKHYFDIYME